MEIYQNYLVLFVILCVNIINAETVINNEYTHEWAIKLNGNEENAKRFARSNNLVLISHVS